MKVDVITAARALPQLLCNWDRVYDADHEAQFFLSSTWLFKRLTKLRTPWLILAAKPEGNDAPYVAFFPLCVKTKMRDGGVFCNELAMAGGYAADYTGLICTPGFEREAIRAFGQHIKELNWAHLNCNNMRASAERLRLLLASFPRETFRIHLVARVNADGTDNCVCPRLELPRNWETYLNSALSPNTRRKLRRWLEQVDRSGEFRITHATAETIDHDIKALLQMWATNWGDLKGERLPGILASTRAMLTDCFESGALFLPVLWKRDTPVGALAILIDEKKRSLLFYIGGRDKLVKNPAPGFVLHAYSIRKAVADGFAVYDFLRGNEAYKYSLGANDQHIKCIVVRTRTGENLGHRMDSRSLPACSSA
jgi:CelD/BcsL family acetyltransferase involved in cellulose biosynthesis